VNRLILNFSSDLFCVVAAHRFSVSFLTVSNAKVHLVVIFQMIAQCWKVFENWF